MLAAGLALWPAAALAAPAWEQWQSVAGAFDLGGPRSDGALIVAGSAALYTLAPDGTLTPFARGPGGYRDDPGAEAYLAVSTGLKVASAGCSFTKDETFLLREHAPIGVTRVDATGSETGSFANVDIPAGLNGIAFDTTGAFGGRLLVTGGVNNKIEVAAVDCAGSVQVITKTAPVVEGGIVVAPQSFGAFGGDLIAPDELSGVIWAIAPDGIATKVADSGLPKGGDIGVESLGFVPPGFVSRGGYVYYSDRSTPGNPHAGTDHVLRLGSSELAAAGVQDGDLLGATEGGASMIDVRCSTTCTVITVVPTPTTAHGEGHLVFTMNAPRPSPSPSARPSSTPAATRQPASAAPYVAIAAGVVAAVVVAIAASRRRRR